MPDVSQRPRFWHSVNRTVATWLIGLCGQTGPQLLAKQSTTICTHLHTSELASAIRLKFKLLVLQQQQASMCQTQPGQG
jgi:hypothetical protein